MAKNFDFHAGRPADDGALAQAYAAETQAHADTSALVQSGAQALLERMRRKPAQEQQAPAQGRPQRRGKKRIEVKKAKVAPAKEQKDPGLFGLGILGF